MDSNLAGGKRKLPPVVGASSPACSDGGAGKRRRAFFATTSLEFECLRRKSRYEMLIGGDDISNDVITLARVFNVCLHSRSFPLCADWGKSNSSVDGEPHGNWRWNSSSRDVVASSPSFSLPAARAPRRACSQATRGGFLMLKTLNHTHTITLKRTGSIGVCS